MKNLFYQAVASILLICVLSACTVPGKVTGGGNMKGVDGDNVAFGFNANSCEGFITGRFNFRDISESQYVNGVGMNGDVTDAGKCTEQNVAGAVESEYCKSSYYENKLGCAEGYVVDVNYFSTNPNVPGSGAAVACVIDNGEGINSTASDAIWVHVSSGPYRNYYNRGGILGNIQAHSCVE